MHPGSTHENRVDPNGPWRYACPECESVRITVNANNGKSGAGPHDYHCRSCWGSFDEPVDRKQQEVAA